MISQLRVSSLASSCPRENGQCTRNRRTTASVRPPVSAAMTSGQTLDFIMYRSFSKKENESRMYMAQNCISRRKLVNIE